jgi:hypothetical protein
MKKALALVFALTCSVATAAVAEDTAAPAGPGQIKGTVRLVEVADHVIILEDGTRLTVSEKQIDSIWAGDQVKAGYVVMPDGSLAITGAEVGRFSNQESD